jgi:hypothetical protein
MERRFESTTWRKESLEGRRNRPGGDKGGGGGGMKQRGELGFKDRPLRPFIRPARGAGRPGTGGRATRRPPEAPRATRAPVPVDPAGA